MSIKRSLFLYGVIPLILCSLLFSIILLTMTTRLLREREETGLINKTRQMAGVLDAELRKMNRISLNLAHSPALKKAIYSYNIMKGKTDNAMSLYYSLRNIQSTIGEHVGPLRQIDQVNAVLPPDEMVSFGLYNLKQPLPPSLAAKLRNMKNLKHNISWTPPETDPLQAAMSTDRIPDSFISLIREIKGNLGEPLGYVEVKEELNRLFHTLEQLSEYFMVFNDKKERFYPSPGIYGSIYADLSLKLIPYRIYHITNPGSGRKEVVCLGISGESPLRLLIIRNEGRYHRPLYSLYGVLLPLILFITVFGYLLSSRLSRVISTPLVKMGQKLNSLDWRSTSESGRSPEKTVLQEVNDLEISFAGMNRKMDENLDKFVAEKTLEVNARVLALQSQMDPHFIYNMLSIIDVMADEGKTDAVQQIIYHLSSLLRYISSLKDLTVPLKMELEMARHYMKCLSYRFGSDLEYILDLPRNTESIKLPRYSVIPLLENVMKYGMPDPPPCRIRLSAERDSTGWVLRVEDNGPGFIQKETEELKDRIHRGILDPAKQLDSQINGMGLFNIMSRCHLVYGNHFSFDLGSSREGGASVSLIYKKEGQND